MNIIKLYMMQNILYFFVLLRQKYIMNQNRYAYNHLYHQCDKVFQPAHFRQLCAITFFGGLWGIVGMIVGVPLFAVIYDLVGKCIRYFLRLRGISQEQEEALR